jgi:hypothetical protein
MGCILGRTIDTDNLSTHINTDVKIHNKCCSKVRKDDCKIEEINNRLARIEEWLKDNTDTG